MYRMMISFSDSSYKKLESFGLGFGHKEYVLPNAEEVCKVIVSLSHLNPVITLFRINEVSADDVLKDFEVKEV